MNPTQEQQDIIKSATEGNNIAIKAFAGTGKTTTLNLISKELKQFSLYVAFNKSIAEEATGKFPSHVECRTIHSLAYHDIIRPNYKMKKKLGFWLDKTDIDLGTLEGAANVNSIKKSISDAIILFCQSDKESILEIIEEDSDRFSGLEDFITEYWNNLIDCDNKAKINPDVYLKLFQLSKPKLDYKIIYLDEFQDSNPVTIDLIFKQLEHGTQLIIVGDSNQAIYEWRGAKNGFNSIPEGFETYYLTESFRFTQKIADIANRLLYIAGEDKELKGKAEPVDKYKTNAIICRSNSAILETLLASYQEKKKVYCLADLKDLFSKMYHISSLYFKSPVKYPNAELVRFKDYQQLQAEADHDYNLARLIKLTIKLSSAPGLFTNINNIKSVLVEDESIADFTLTTAHKSKGLEWDNVILAEDIFYLIDEESTAETLATGQLLNLIYVAVTRAKYKVTLPVELNEVISNYREYKQEYLDLISQL